MAHYSEISDGKASPYDPFNSVTAEKAQEVIEQAESFYNFTIKT